MTDTDEMANAYKLSCERVARLEREIDEMKESMQTVYEFMENRDETHAWTNMLKWSKKGWIK